jgi:hypothetical protein
MKVKYFEKPTEPVLSYDAHAGDFIPRNGDTVKIRDHTFIVTAVKFIPLEDEIRVYVR